MPPNARKDVGLDEFQDKPAPFPEPSSAEIVGYRRAAQWSGDRFARMAGQKIEPRELEFRRFCNLNPSSRYFFCTHAGE